VRIDSGIKTGKKPGGPWLQKAPDGTASQALFYKTSVSGPSLPVLGSNLCQVTHYWTQAANALLNFQASFSPCAVFQVTWVSSLSAQRHHNIAAFVHFLAGLKVINRYTRKAFVLVEEFPAGPSALLAQLADLMKGVPIEVTCGIVALH
jgi:hypothetical protein